MCICLCVFIYVCIYLCKPLWYCFGEIWGQLYERWAKELSFPVLFYSLSLCTMQCQKCNSIYRVTELQQCILIAVSQKVSTWAYIGNLFVSLESWRTKILFGMHFWAYTPHQIVPWNKNWLVCDLQIIWEVSAAGDQPKILENDVCSYTSEPKFSLKSWGLAKWCPQDPYHL